jgi:site-specific recombinase XerD
MNPNLKKGVASATLTPEMESALVDFLNEKRSQGLSKTSVGHYNPAPLTRQSDTEMGKYGFILTRFAVWLAASQNITRPNEITRRAVVAWAAVKTEGRAPATARTSIQVIRSFLKWATASKLIPDDLAASIKAPKVKRRIQRTLTAAEVQKLLDACDHTDIGIRNRAIIALLVDSGLRCSELCSLTIFDLYFVEDEEESHYVTVIGKGGNEGRGYFSEATAYPLRRWLETRLRLQFTRPTHALFVSIGGDTPGQPLTRYGLRQIVSELGQRAGVADISPHALRRTFATLMIAGGAPSRTVQAAGRWSDLTMVEHYTQALETSQAYRQYAPMGRVTRKARRRKAGGDT